MSYQKKIKSDFIYFFFLVLTALLILSFTSRKVPKRQIKSNNAVSERLIHEATGINYLQCFKMDKAVVDKYLQGGAGKKRVILELGTNDITSPDPAFVLFSYLAKNHRTHGAGEDPDELTVVDVNGRCLEFKAGTKYVIGNNYVTVKKLKAFIDLLLNQDYSYIQFTPIEKNIKGETYIAFKFAAYDISKKLIELKTQTLVDDETNPCPPNKPTD